MSGCVEIDDRNFQGFQYLLAHSDVPSTCQLYTTLCIRIYRSVDYLMSCECASEDGDYDDVDDKNDDFNDDDVGEMVMSITMMIAYRCILWIHGYST